MHNLNCSPDELMTVAAARCVTSDDVCFVGIGLPSAACNLARLTHAPGITLIYESGTIGVRPTVLPLSIGDGELCTTALTTVSVPEFFRYWLPSGRITVGFLGAAQIDRFIDSLPKCAAPQRRRQSMYTIRSMHTRSQCAYYTMSARAAPSSVRSTARPVPRPVFRCPPAAAAHQRD